MKNAQPSRLAGRVAATNDPSRDWARAQLAGGLGAWARASAALLTLLRWQAAVSSRAPRNRPGLGWQLPSNPLCSLGRGGAGLVTIAQPSATGCPLRQTRRRLPLGRGAPAAVKFVTVGRRCSPSGGAIDLAWRALGSSCCSASWSVGSKAPLRLVVGQLNPRWSSCA